MAESENNLGQILSGRLRNVANSLHRELINHPAVENADLLPLAEITVEEVEGGAVVKMFVVAAKSKAKKSVGKPFGKDGDEPG